MKRTLLPVIASAVMFVAVGAGPAAAGSISLAWDPDTDPDVTGYTVSYGTRSGIYTTTIDVGLRRDHRLVNMPSSGKVYVAVRAYNVSGVYSAYSAEVVADMSGNQPPTLENPGNQRLRRGVGFWLPMLADDPEGMPLQFSATGLPAGMEIDADTGVISCGFVSVAPGFQKAAVKVTVKDPHGATATQSFDIETEKLPATRLVDFDGDGRDDVFLYSEQTGDWTLATARARGFVYKKGRWASGFRLVPARFSTSPLVDLFMYSEETGTWAKAYNAGQGRFHLFRGSTAPGWTVVVGDFEGDKRDDLLLYNAVTGEWVLYRNFRLDNETAPSGQWAPGWTVSVGALNGDRLDDLLLYNPQTGAASVGLSSGVGEWRWVNQQWLAAADVYLTKLDADRVDDVFLYKPSTGDWWVGVTSGDGVFTSAKGKWDAGLALRFVDMNRDGRNDMWAYNADSGKLTVCGNLGGVFQCLSAPWEKGWEIASAEFNGDGRGDVLLHHPLSGTYLEALTSADGSFSFLSGRWSARREVVGKR